MNVLTSHVKTQSSEFKGNFAHYQELLADWRRELERLPGQEDSPALTRHRQRELNASRRR